MNQHWEHVDGSCCRRSGSAIPASSIAQHLNRAVIGLEHVIEGDLVFRQPQLIAAGVGFASSFRDWAAEKTDHPREVAEAALAHVVRNQVEAAYRRTDLFERRRRLMDDWADYLAGER